MKIIFLKDVPRIAKKYYVKDVADGHGRHLVMKKVADVSQKKMNEELLMKTLATLDGASITFYGKANEKGHLFASIHREEVLAELKRSAHLDMNQAYFTQAPPSKQSATSETP